jgi:hypothetical protein
MTILNAFRNSFSRRRLAYFTFALNPIKTHIMRNSKLQRKASRRKETLIGREIERNGFN